MDGLATKLVAIYAFAVSGEMMIAETRPSERARESVILIVGEIIA